MAAISISSPVFLLACFIIGFAASADTNTRDALMKQLRERASHDSPPPDKDLPVNVKSEIKILGIDSLCPIIYLVKARAYEFYTWTDSRLAWSLSDFNVSYVALHSGDIWVPSMAIWQNMAETPTHNDKNHVFVMSTGEVRFTGMTTYKLACNATAWEDYLKTNKGGNNDTYKCSFVLGTGDYDSTVVDVAAPVKASAQPNSDQQWWMPTTADMGWYKPNAAYDVQSFDVERSQMTFPLGNSTGMLNWSILNFDLIVKRLKSMSACPYSGMKGGMKKPTNLPAEVESDNEAD